MNYKNQRKYLEAQAFPEIRTALIAMRDLGIVKGRFANTGAISRFIYEHPDKYPNLSARKSKHVHESIGVFLLIKVKGVTPYNRSSHRSGGRTYFIPGGVESI